MADPAALSFRRIGWDTRATRDLWRIEGCTSADIAFYRRSVEVGARGLMAIELAGARVGSMVWTLEVEPNGRVLVVDAMGAEPIEGISLAHAADAVARQLARSHGAIRLRFWTERPGLVRKMERAGYRKRYVMEAVAR